MGNILNITLKVTLGKPQKKDIFLVARPGPDPRKPTHNWIQPRKDIEKKGPLNLDVQNREKGYNGAVTVLA